MTSKTAINRYAEAIAELEGERLKRVDAAWNDREEARQKLPSAEQAEAEAHEAVEQIEVEWAGGNETHSADDHARAKSEVVRAATLARGLRTRANQVQPDREARETRVADAVAETARSYFHRDVAVLTTTLPANSVPTPDLSALPVLVLCQTSPTVVDESGILKASIEAVYWRKAYHATLDFKPIAELGRDTDAFTIGDFLINDYGVDRVSTRKEGEMFRDSARYSLGTDSKPGGVIPSADEAVVSGELYGMPIRRIVSEAVGDILEPYYAGIEAAGKRAAAPLLSNPRVISDETKGGKRLVTVRGRLHMPEVEHIAPAYRWIGPGVPAMMKNVADPKGRFLPYGGRCTDFKWEADNNAAVITVTCESKAAA